MSLFHCKVVFLNMDAVEKVNWKVSHSINKLNGSASTKVIEVFIKRSRAVARRFVKEL